MAANYSRSIMFTTGGKCSRLIFVQRDDRHTLYWSLRPLSFRQLHFGSLIAALGSYLQARTRKVAGWYALKISTRLVKFPVPRDYPAPAGTLRPTLGRRRSRQSQRHHAYREALAWLHEQG